MGLPGRGQYDAKSEKGLLGLPGLGIKMVNTEKPASSFLLDLLFFLWFTTCGGKKT